MRTRQKTTMADMRTTASGLRIEGDAGFYSQKVPGVGRMFTRGFQAWYIGDRPDSNELDGNTLNPVDCMFVRYDAAAKRGVILGETNEGKRFESYFGDGFPPAPDDWYDRSEEPRETVFTTTHEGHPRTGDDARLWLDVKDAFECIVKRKP